MLTVRSDVLKVVGWGDCPTCGGVKFCLVYVNFHGNIWGFCERCREEFYICSLGDKLNSIVACLEKFNIRYTDTLRRKLNDARRMILGVERLPPGRKALKVYRGIADRVLEERL